MRLQDALPLVHVPVTASRGRQGRAEQRQAIRGRRPGSVGAACGGRLLGQEGDELVAVRVEGVLDAVADARVAVQLRRRHGCRAARQWSVDRSLAASAAVRGREGGCGGAGGDWRIAKWRLARDARTQRKAAPDFIQGTRRATARRGALSVDA